MLNEMSEVFMHIGVLTVIQFSVCYAVVGPGDINSLKH